MSEWGLVQAVKISLHFHAHNIRMSGRFIGSPHQTPAEAAQNSECIVSGMWIQVLANTVAKHAHFPAEQDRCKSRVAPCAQGNSSGSLAVCNGAKS